MATNKKYTIPLKRKKLGLTDYKSRLNLILSKKPRLVVRRSLNKLTAQLIIYDKKGDKILFSFDTKKLKEFGWKFHTGNLPSAYLLGYLVGFEAKKIKLAEVVLDIGLNESINGSSIYALLKGALDSGLKIQHDNQILPSEDRIKGKHIINYYSKLSQNDKNKQFSKYLKNNVNVGNIEKDFEDIKSKISNKYKNA